MSAREPCTANATSWPQGFPCKECGHNGSMHRGRHNPNVRECLACRIDLLWAALTGEYK